MSGLYSRVVKTRFFAQTGIVIARLSPDLWQHLDTSDGKEAQVGPQYKSKTEALADHERYLTEHWGVNGEFNRDDYRVQELAAQVPGWGLVVHLKVRRIDGKGGIPWEFLQAIKDGLYPADRAIEVYPRSGDVVNDANIRHLWIVPETVVLPNLKW